jgi:secreted PhoX family phosphatase
MRASHRTILVAALAAAAAAIAATLLEPGCHTTAGPPHAPFDSLLANWSDAAGGRALGYGPLVRDSDGLLDLPAGFRYTLLSTAALDRDLPGEGRFVGQLDDGSPTPPEFDGMAAFAGPDSFTILVDPVRHRTYDSLGTGGTTTLWVTPGLRVAKQFASLSGTLVNCCGGRTPWGTWISAEECAYLPGAHDPLNADRDPRVSRPHGYLFEVDARATTLVEPVPLKAMGRFRHEALAVDPGTGIAYLTEDRPDGIFYRFIPSAVSQAGRRPSELRAGDYARGGTLEALRIVGRPSTLTQNWGERTVKPRERLRVEWVRIPKPDPDGDETWDPADARPDSLHRKRLAASGSTRAQGWALGCAQFARSEGITWYRGAAYFCCTSGGPAVDGQVWKLDPARGELTLLLESADRNVLEGPDNLCPAPNGDLVICEDGGTENYLTGVTRDGRTYHLARNAHPMHREFAGACFSPDERTLFVNVQQPSMTFAIRGPWETRKK